MRPDPPSFPARSPGWPPVCLHQQAKEPDQTPLRRRLRALVRRIVETAGEQIGGIGEDVDAVAVDGFLVVIGLEQEAGEGHAGGFTWYPPPTGRGFS